VRAIHRAIPGRARFAVAGLYRDAALAQALEGQLRHRSGIYSASANSLTGKVLVLFDSGLDLEQIEARLEETIGLLERGRGAGIARNGDGVAAQNGYDVDPNGSMLGDGGPIWHRLPVSKALSLLESSPEAGLGESAVAARLERWGPNRLPDAAPRSGLGILAEQFSNLPVALLGVSAALALVTGGVLEANRHRLRDRPQCGHRLCHRERGRADDQCSDR
jgi:P-type Ca2+ transporter type 2C